MLCARDEPLQASSRVTQTKGQAERVGIDIDTGATARIAGAEAGARKGAARKTRLN